MNNTNYSNIVERMARIMTEMLNSEDRSDKTFKAKVTENINTNKYIVLYNGVSYTVSSSVTCSIGDFVRICAPCNNWNDLFIVCKTK